MDSMVPHVDANAFEAACGIMSSESVSPELGKVSMLQQQSREDDRGLIGRGYRVDVVKARVEGSMLDASNS